MDPDEIAEPYALVASELAAHVRDDPPVSMHRWLYEAMRDVAAARGRPRDVPTVVDWMSLAIAQAVAIQPGEWEAMSEWLRRPDLRPHGTMAALRRHQDRKERACALCRAWEAGFRAGRREREAT